MKGTALELVSMGGCNSQAEDGGYRAFIVIRTGSEMNDQV